MSSDTDTEQDEVGTIADPLELEEWKVFTPINLLPEKSKMKYEKAYKAFMDWRSLKDTDSISENTLLAYFEDLSLTYKSSSLWANYSMLRSTLQLHHGINIETYSELRALLKRKSEGYQAKKAKIFTSDEINKFINKAPDCKYLATKVALIMGVLGSCHARQLHLMSVDDLQDLGSAMMVTVPNSRSDSIRKFTITDEFYTICKKYADLRPSKLVTNSFFLHYQDGKCRTYQMGKNKLGGMAKEIAKFLELPNPEAYTGHSLRSKLKGEQQIQQWVDQSASYTENTTSSNQTINLDVNSTPSLIFTNCSNITINIITNKPNK